MGRFACGSGLFPLPVSHLFWSTSVKPEEGIGYCCIPYTCVYVCV